MKISPHRLFLLSVLFFAFACANTSESDAKKKLLTRKWVYGELQVNGETMTGPQLENPTMEFLQDGTYKADLGQYTEGVWRMEKGDLYMRAKQDKTEYKLQIKELTDQKVVLYNKDSVEVVITLVLPPAE